MCYGPLGQESAHKRFEKYTNTGYLCSHKQLQSGSYQHYDRRVIANLSQILFWPGRLLQREEYALLRGLDSVLSAVYIAFVVSSIVLLVYMNSNLWPSGTVCWVA